MAHKELSLGLNLIEVYDAPLAAWRLHALAAEEWDDNSHRQEAEAVIRRLAGSLPDGDHLKEDFISSAFAFCRISWPEPPARLRKKAVKL